MRSLPDRPRVFSILLATVASIVVGVLLIAGATPSPDGIKTPRQLDQGDLQPVAGVVYEIKDGDTLASIAAEYDLTVADIASWNGISGNAALVVGRRMVIPIRQ
jgi:LysM repeat protein